MLMVVWCASMSVVVIVEPVEGCSGTSCWLLALLLILFYDFRRDILASHSCLVVGASYLTRNDKTIGWHLHYIQVVLVTSVRHNHSKLRSSA